MTATGYGRPATGKDTTSASRKPVAVCRSRSFPG